MMLSLSNPYNSAEESNIYFRALRKQQLFDFSFEFVSFLKVFSSLSLSIPEMGAFNPRLKITPTLKLEREASDMGGKVSHSAIRFPTSND